MAVTRTIQRPERRGRFGVMAKREFELVYLVITDDSQDDAEIVKQASGLPRIGDGYIQGTSSVPTARCTELNCDQVDDLPTHWMVTATFETPDVQEVPGDSQESQPPGDREGSVTIRFETREVPATMARVFNDLGRNTGKPVVNSAGEAINPVPQVMRGTLVIALTRYYYDATIPRLREYHLSVNEDSFAGFPEGTLQMRMGELQETYENGIRVWVLRIELHYDPDGWDLVVEDQGTYSNVGGVKRRFRDDDGDGTGVRNLDGAGGELADGAEPVFLTFRVYARKTFGTVLPDLDKVRLL